MSFYLSRKISGTFEAVSKEVENQLHAHDYLIAADINVQAALKQKLDADLPPIRIICTNTPKVGLRLFNSDPKFGTLLPFSIVIHALSENEVEVSTIDPEFLFQSIENPEIKNIATEVKTVFNKILDNL